MPIKYVCIYCGKTYPNAYVNKKESKDFMKLHLADKHLRIIIEKTLLGCIQR